MLPLNSAPAPQIAPDLPCAAHGPVLSLNPGGFDDWTGLLDLMRDAFSDTIGRVDPPSTVFRSTLADLARRAETEDLLIARDARGLAGCLFLRHDWDELFLGRFAIARPHRGSGLARRMITRALSRALTTGKTRLVLETRVTLRDNQQRFRALGFSITGGRAHAGYTGVTTLRMVRPIG